MTSIVLMFTHVLMSTDRQTRGGAVVAAAVVVAVVVVAVGLVMFIHVYIAYTQG